MAAQQHNKEIIRLTTVEAAVQSALAKFPKDEALQQSLCQVRESIKILQDGAPPPGKA